MLKTKLYSFQTEDVRRIRENNGTVLLANEVGLGKTLTTIYYAWRYLPKDPPGPIVAVVPSHLKINWKHELQKHLGERAQILAGERVPPDFPAPLDPNSVLVINYDVLVPPRWPRLQAPPAGSWIAWLAALRPRLLVGDEGHMLSNADSARTRAFRWLARRSARTTILTGTPLANKPGNLWAPLNILWPVEFPSEFDFGAEYAYPVKERGRWNYKGARNLPALHARLKRVGMIRRRKADVLKDLPAVTYSVVPLACDLREYRRAEADAVAWVAAQDGLRAGARAGRTAELAQITVLKQEAARAKMDAVLRWVSDHLEGGEGKLLLGAVHYAVTDALMGALGESAILVDGRINDKKKAAAFDKFNRDSTCRVLVGNLQAAGTGWSCTATSDVAFVELPWRPSDVTQFSGRVHGVERGVPGTAAHIRFLLAAGTIEERICKGIQQKEGWSVAAIDGDPGAAELDLHDQLLSYLRSQK